VAWKAISTPDAPAAIGPYSQAIRTGNLIFVAGQIPLDPASGQLAATDIAGQTEQVLKNIGAILKAAGASYEHVVKTTVFLLDMGEFTAVNEVYAKFFPPARDGSAPPPARATVQVSRLPRDVRVEIDVIAALD
jgi:2-iminobutanoate/2-iminopropanoate deaminase